MLDFEGELKKILDEDPLGILKFKSQSIDNFRSKIKRS